MIATERAAAILRPWLGSAFVARHADVVERIAVKLGAFVPGRDSLERMAQDVDNLLFMTVRNDTSARMLLSLDNQTQVRVRVSDFAVMADELLYLLFEAVRAHPQALAIVQQYSLRTNSLASLKALYVLFAAGQSQEEIATVRRIIKTCHPPFRWRSWLE